MEHSSNDLPWRRKFGESFIKILVNEKGVIDLTELEKKLSDYNHKNKHGKKRIKLISFSGASNVLGTCNDIKKISQLTHKYRAMVHVDAAQLIAHKPIDMKGTGIDFLSFSAHKMYAPFGSGALVSRKGGLREAIEGGYNPYKSNNSQNIAGIVAMGKAMVLLERIGMDIVQEYEKGLTIKILSEMTKIPELNVYGIKSIDNPIIDQRLGVFVIELKGMMANEMAKKLTLHGGLGIRYGCHCAHVMIKRLLNVGPGLEKFQRIMLTLLPNINLPGLLRISIGIENTEEDIDGLMENIHSLANKKGADSRKSVSKLHLKNRIKDLIKENEALVYGY